MEEVIEQLRELNEPVPVPLELPDDVKTELKALSPASYVGNAIAQAKAL